MHASSKSVLVALIFIMCTQSSFSLGNKITESESYSNLVKNQRGSSIQEMRLAKSALAAAPGHISMPPLQVAIALDARPRVSIKDYLTKDELNDSKLRDLKLDFYESIQKAINTAAKRHQTLDFDGITARISNRLTVSGNNFTLLGNGAKLVRSTSTTATTVFYVKDAHHVSITGFKLYGQYDGSIKGSTGSNETIQLGDLTDPNDNSVNDDVNISGNYIRYSNGAIVVTGRHGDDRVIKNKNIRIDGNVMEDAGYGVFIYKNSENISVTNNIAKNMGASSYAVDSQAQTDNTGTGPVNKVIFKDNIGLNIGQKDGQIGEGVLFKGACIDCAAIGNVIINAGSRLNASPQYGILLTRDYSHQAPQSITVSNNTVINVSSMSSGAWSLYIGQGSKNILIKNNLFDTAMRGLYVNAAENVSIVNNDIVNQASSPNTFPVEVYAKDGQAKNVEISGNDIFSAGAPSGNRAIVINNGANINLGENLIRGYKKGMFVNCKLVSLTATPYVAHNIELSKCSTMSRHP